MVVPEQPIFFNIIIQYHQTKFMITGLLIGIVSAAFLAVFVSLFMTYYIDRQIKKINNKDLDIHFDEQDIY